MRVSVSIFCLLLALCPAFADSSPTTRPSHRPSTEPVQVPYTLSDSNHLLVRLKINGKGPFNFIIDTGSPAMILRVPVAQQLGLKVNSRGTTNIDTLEIEGGAVLSHVMCLVDTPFQIEGMNAIGATGVDLDGLLGYSVLAKFRLQIDMTKDRMTWTPLTFTPPPMQRVRHRRNMRTSTTRPSTMPAEPDVAEEKESNLESVGGLLKLVGPLIKTTPLVPKVRGIIGIELAENGHGVMISRVLGGSPAAAAGVKADDRVMAVNSKTVDSITAVQSATARILAGQTIHLSLQRGSDTLNLAIVAGEGF